MVLVTANVLALTSSLPSQVLGHLNHHPSQVWLWLHYRRQHEWHVERLPSLRTTISKLLRDAAIPISSPRQMTKAQVDQAVHLYEQGQSLAQIGSRLGWATPPSTSS